MRQSDLERAARDEGQVVWYTGLLWDEVAMPMCRAFEARYPGISAICDRSHPIDAVGKAIAEAGRGLARCDVFDGVGSPPAALIAALDCPLHPDEMPALLGDLPPDRHEAEGRWAAQILYHATHAWNPRLIPSAEAPRRLEDLLHPRWRGMMCWSRDTLAGRPGFVALALHHFGEAEGLSYLQALATQGITALDGLGRDTMAVLGRGDFALALQVFAHHAMIERAAGGHVDWAGESPVLSFPNPISLCRTAPHPAAARLFLQFVVSPAGQQVMRQGMHVPALPEVAPLDQALCRVKGYLLTPGQIAHELPRWRSMGQAIFGDG